MSSALLFELGGLGDLLLAFPSIYFLRKKLPYLSLTLVGRKEYALLLKETGVVDQVVSASDLKFVNLFKRPSSVDAEYRQWLTSFSLVLGWLQKEKSRELENYFLSLGIENCQFFVFEPNESLPLHKYFFKKTQEFLNRFHGPEPGFDECCSLPSILSMKERPDLFNEKALPMGKRFVVIHPGSGSLNKCWPLENFLNIINRLNQAGWSGILITGEAEQGMLNTIKKFSFSRAWAWLHNPPLLKLAAILQTTTLYLGNDSGVTHLAALCGTKVVALFRKEFKAFWKPCGRPLIISAASLSQISIDSVWAAISRLLELIR